MDKIPHQLIVQIYKYSIHAQEKCIENIESFALLLFMAQIFGEPTQLIWPMPVAEDKPMN